MSSHKAMRGKEGSTDRGERETQAEIELCQCRVAIMNGVTKEDGSRSPSGKIYTEKSYGVTAETREPSTQLNMRGLYSP